VPDVGDAHDRGGDSRINHDAGDTGDDHDDSGIRQIVSAWTPGLLYGVVAALLGYGLVGGFLALEVRAATAGPGALTRRALVAGTLGDFYTAHLGATTDVAFGVRGVSAVPAPAYYLVPLVALAWGGRRTARASGSTPGVSWPTARAGARVVAGYAPLVLLGLGVLRFVGGPSGNDALRIALVAGVVYPVVVGSLAGYVTTSDRSLSGFL